MLYMKRIILVLIAISILQLAGIEFAVAQFRVLAVKSATNVVGQGPVAVGQELKSGTVVRTGPTGQVVVQYQTTFNIFQLTSNTTAKFGVGEIKKITEVMHRMIFQPVSWTLSAKANRPTWLLTQAARNAATQNGILIEIQSGGVMFNVDLPGTDVGGLQANTTLGQGVFSPEGPSKIMIYHQKGEGNLAPQVPGARMGEFTAYVIPKDDDVRLDVVGKNTVINTKINEEVAKSQKENRVDELFAAFKDGAGNQIKPAGNLLYLEYIADFILPDFKDFDGKVETIMNGGTITIGPPAQPIIPPIHPVPDIQPASQ